MKLAHVLLVIALALAANCNPCETTKGDCCERCRTDYFLANCHCLQQGKYVEFISKMSETTFLAFFVALPIIVGLVVYLVLAKNEVSGLLEKAKLQRLKPAVIYPNRDMSTTFYVQQKTEVLDIDDDHDANE